MAHYKFIVNHLTDTDFYKFTMGQCIKHRFPNERTKWELKIRTKGVKLGYLKDEIEYQLDHLCTLRFQKDELEYLASIPWFTKDYIEWLEDLQLKRRYLHVYVDNDEQIRIEADGPWLRVFWFEIFVMEIVQELYMKDQKVDLEVAKKNLDVVIDNFNAATDAGLKFTLADFGARRRYSYEWQEYVVEQFAKRCKCFVGTSNVYFAMKYGIKPIGRLCT